MVPADRTHVLEVEKHLDDLRSAERKDKGMSVARYMSEGPAVPYGKKKLMMYGTSRIYPSLVFVGQLLTFDLGSPLDLPPYPTV
jgi:hypothetical protein